MATKHGRLPAAIIILLLTAGTVWSQDETKPLKSASLEGTTGLFRVWDAESLRQFEANLSFGWSRYHRDPGQLRFNLLPVGVAVGLTDRFEVFASWDAYKRVRAGNIRPYRVLPDRSPVPAWTPGGAAAFNNEAPFIDVPLGTGVGDVQLGAKFNLFSERRDDPLAMALVGFVKIPTHDSPSSLNRGLGTGEFDGGFGLLFSKLAGNANFHLNTMLNWVGDPERDDIELAELQNEFWYRGGVAFPARSRLQGIAEFDGKIYFGARDFGLNPRDPIDLIFGFRAFPTRWMSIGGGYRASLNHIDDQPARNVFGAGTHGFVAQIAFGKRVNDPPSVTCAAAAASILQDDTTTVKATAFDPEGDTLTYTWTSSGGKVSGSGDTATFDATGVAPGQYTVTVTVSDGKNEVTCTTQITVLKRNVAPTVSCAPPSTTITAGESATIRATASDANNDPLTYAWTVNNEKMAASGPEFVFGSEGREPGTYTVTVTVSDGELTATCSSTVTVQPRPNRPPSLECLTTSVDVAAGGTVELRVRATDPDNDKVAITWSATGGSVSGTGETATFNASGLRAGIFTVTATADDGRGGSVTCNVTVNVSERVTLPPGSEFGIGSRRVNNVAKAALDDIAVRMQNEPRLHANIIGYTDNSRRETRIKGLGARRAQAVADYLVSKGVDRSRLTVTDGGTANPVGDNKTAAGRRQNRRVEIELAPQ
jgi:outer membrane protein OmpA-like peptidoglycan-associated protein